MVFSTTLIAIVAGLGQAAVTTQMPTANPGNPTIIPMSPTTPVVDAVAAYTGDLTWFTPGLGACQLNNNTNDPIVAVATGVYDANNVCGKSITITYKGAIATGVIEDRCGSCNGGDLDLSPAVFTQFAPLSSGRLNNADWDFI